MTYSYSDEPPEEGKGSQRVLVVLGSGQVGGIERLMVDLFTILRDDPDLECDLFFKEGEGPLYAEALSISGGRGVHTAKGFRHRVRVFKGYDLLHFQGFSPAVAFTAWVVGRPIIYHEHGNFGFGRRPTWKDRVKHPLRRAFVGSKRVTKTIAVSHFIDSFAAGYYGPRWSRKSVIIYNGTNMDNRLSEDSGPPERKDSIVLGYLGRLAGFKHVDRLLELLSGSPRTWTARIVGGGPALAALQDLTMQRKLHDRVVFEDFRLDVGTFYAEVDCLVLPSRPEPFGLVVLEAWSHGIPAFVFADSGGAAEVVSRLDPYFVCTDSEQMRVRITEFFGHPDRRQQFLAQVQGIRDEFSIGRFTQDMKRHYLSSIAEYSRGDSSMTATRNTGL